jgi:phage gp16-like protein
MPKSPPKIGNKQKALIHVAKSNVGMSEEAYRDMLASVGVTSSKDLNVLQFEEIMRRFEAAGFKSTGKGSRKRPPRPASGKEALMSKVGAILADTGLEWAYVDGMARKMFGVDSVRFCNQTQLWKIVAALSIYLKRKERGSDGRHKRGGPRTDGTTHGPDGGTP